MLASPITGARAWQADSLTPAQWRVGMSEAVLEELDAIASSVRQLSTPIESLDLDRFEMPCCHAMMAQVKAILDDGAGFAVLDRLPVERLGEETAIALYWLLASLVARPVAQNVRGTRIYRVQDTGRRALPGSGVRPDQTNAEQNFHNDNAYSRVQPEYIGLLCVRPAVHGGESSLVSLASVHNVLLHEHPEALARLYQPFWIDRQREHLPDEPLLLHEPVFSFDGRLRARMGIHTILNGYALRGEPLDEEGRTAIEALRGVFARDRLVCRFMMAPGQIQFVSNLAIGHRRTGFTDAEDPARRRLMVRIWMRDEGAASYDG